MSSHQLVRSIVALVAAATWSSVSSAAQTPGGGPSGSATFALYCATCHGPSAKGDGPLASSMRRKPANLTELAKRNGGTFPSDQVARTVDGRNLPKGHGGGDMPVWGPAFAKSAASDTSSADERIRRLVTYLESIQVK